MLYRLHEFFYLYIRWYISCPSLWFSFKDLPLYLPLMDTSRRYSRHWLDCLSYALFDITCYEQMILAFCDTQSITDASFLLAKLTLHSLFCVTLVIFARLLTVWYSFLFLVCFFITCTKASLKPVRDLACTQNLASVGSFKTALRTRTQTSNCLYLRLCPWNTDEH